MCPPGLRSRKKPGLDRVNFEIKNVPVNDSSNDNRKNCFCRILFLFGHSHAHTFWKFLIPYKIAKSTRYAIVVVAGYGSCFVAAVSLCSLAVHMPSGNGAEVSYLNCACQLRIF